MKLGRRKYRSATLKIARAEGLPFHMQEGVLELTTLFVPAEDRGKGYASRLMRQVMTEADADMKVLMLTVSPFGDEGYADVDQLMAFYATHGFVRIQEKPILMARRPIPTKPVEIVVPRGNIQRESIPQIH